MSINNASFADSLQHVGRPSPRVFGGPVWSFLESVALALPDTLKPEEQVYLKNWLLRVAQCMPCGKCGKDFERRIRAMNNQLQSRGNVLASFTIFQREIQQQNRGRVKSFEEHYNKIANLGHGFAGKISTQPTFTDAAKKAHLISRDSTKRGAEGQHSLPAIFAQLQVHQKEQWGPHGWLFLYYMMMGLPDQPNNLQVREFLESTFSMLPCDSCTQHALKYLRTHSPSIVPLRTRGHWIAFVSNMHNAVNKRLGKRCLAEAERLALLERLPQNNYVFFHAPEEKKKKHDDSAYVNHKDSGITIVLVLVSITGLFGLVALSTNALLRR